MYDGDNVIETTNQSGGLLSRFAQGQNIDEPLAESTSSGTDYYEADGLGSITSLTNSAGQVAQTYTYDSFGNTTHSTGSLANPFQYTARDFDSETGLYYYRARYYDPTVGRFMTPDWSANPEAISYSNLSDPQTLNLYTYVHDNPINKVDKDGHCYPLCTVAIGAGAGAIIGATSEAIKEKWDNPHRPLNKHKIANAAIAGAIAGAVTGAVGPEAAVGTKVLTVVAADLVGGMSERTLNRENPINVPEMEKDAGTAVIGGTVDAEADKAIRSEAVKKEATAALDFATSLFDRTASGQSSKANEQESTKPQENAPPPPCGPNTRPCDDTSQARWDGQNP